MLNSVTSGSDQRAIIELLKIGPEAQQNLIPVAAEQYVRLPWP